MDLWIKPLGEGVCTTSTDVTKRGVPQEEALVRVAVTVRVKLHQLGIPHLGAVQHKVKGAASPSNILSNWSVLGVDRSTVGEV